MKILHTIFPMMLLVLSGVADATPLPVWNSNGAGCVPDIPAMQYNRYLDTGGSTKHQSTNADVITLYCPITMLVNETAPDNLRVTYQDNDNTNTGTPTDVTVTLNAVSDIDGTLSTIATFSSTSFPATFGGGVQNTVAITGYTFELGLYYYYLRVDIQRHSASGTCIGGGPCTAIFYGASLTQGT